jgi:hypothetical protein
MADDKAPPSTDRRIRFRVRLPDGQEAVSVPARLEQTEPPKSPTLTVEPAKK